MKTILTKFAVIWEHLSKKGPKSSFSEHDKLEHQSIKGKRKEKKKPARSKKAGEEKEEKKEKKGCTNRE